MIISGVSLEQFERCVEHVSDEMYGGNAIMHADSKELPGVRRPRCQATVAVRDPRGLGTRVTRMGVHRPYACWHLYRDVLAEVFRRYPDALIRTRDAVYRGWDGFLATYPATAHINVGSVMEPVTSPELCQCSATLSGARDRLLHGQLATYVVTQAERLDRNQCELLAATVRSYEEEAQRRSDALVADVKCRQAEIDREFPPDDAVFGPRVRMGTNFSEM